MSFLFFWYTDKEKINSFTPIIMIYLEKKHIPLLVFNLGVIAFFGSKFLSPLNYEFLIYIGVIIVFLLLILFTNKYMRYNMLLLWCLSIWAFLHMAGGGLSYQGVIWYQQILIPISEYYSILRYDQMIHAFGFFTATLLSYEILKIQLKTPKVNFGLGLVLVMAGCGFGAFNEIIEFIVDQSLPESGVGGYINTSLDLISNFVWAVIAVVCIKLFLEKR